VTGRIDELAAALTEHSDLATRRSRYGHRATLLHYTAANGVEIRRQVVPSNADRIALLLLGAGADARARLHAYGGLYDRLALLRTSGHPSGAGPVAARLERVLAS